MSNCAEFVLTDEAPGFVQTKERDVSTAPDTETTAVASDGPTVAEVMQVVFDVGRGEREAYIALAGNEPCSAGVVASELDLDRSTVNRYLISLYRKDLVMRRRRILQSGGHVYEYRTRSAEYLRELLLAGLQNWTDAADDRINQLGAELSETDGRITA